jgi:hypothetical protein
MTDTAVKASLNLAAKLGGTATDDTNAGFGSLDGLKKHLMGEEVVELSQADKANSALQALGTDSVSAEEDLASFFGEETVGTSAGTASTDDTETEVNISITISGAGKVSVR